MIVLDILKFSIFPGIATVFIIGLISAWYVRKLTAKFENRIGPPLMQPIYDILKLLAKEKTYPENSHKVLIFLLPRLQLFAAIFMSFLIPINNEEGLISFEGDILVFLFLLAFHGIIILFLGFSSNNPYTTTGYGRVGISELSFELPLIFAFSSLVYITKSTRISEIINGMYGLNLDLRGLTIRLILIILFVIFIINSLGFLEFNPFSAGHAETEIVGGWQTELNGANLAYVYITDIFNLYSLTGLISTIFLTFTFDFVLDIEFIVQLLNTATFLIKFTIVLTILGFIKTISSRIRIDQTVNFVWNLILPISLFGVVTLAIIM